MLKREDRQLGSTMFGTVWGVRKSVTSRDSVSVKTGSLVDTVAIVTVLTSIHCVWDEFSKQHMSLKMGLVHC